MIKLRALVSKSYYKSMLLSGREKKNFKSIRTYCMFIGYPRSGHSFLSALLDAHPNIVMGMEVDALNLVDLGYSRNQIYYCIIHNAKIFTHAFKNIWTGYSYAIPDSHQGDFKEILIIGDKKGGRSTLRLGENPELFNRLSTITRIPIKIFHVIRNPFDNIATIMLRYMEMGFPLNYETLKSRIDFYFIRVEINSRLRQRKDFNILEVYHEKFIEDPKATLKRMLDFLQIDAPIDYFEKCSCKAYKSPNKSRHKINWPDELKLYVEQKIATYPFLSHYRFKDD
jgi:hypothetical protein